MDFMVTEFILLVLGTTQQSFNGEDSFVVNAVAVLSLWYLSHTLQLCLGLLRLLSSLNSAVM